MIMNGFFKKILSTSVVAALFVAAPAARAEMPEFNAGELQALSTVAPLNLINWKVGDTMSYSLSMLFGKGSMVKSVSKEEGKRLADAGAMILTTTGFGPPVFGVFADDNKPRFRDGKPWPEGIVDGVRLGEEARGTRSEIEAIGAPPAVLLLLEEIHATFEAEVRPLRQREEGLRSVRDRFAGNIIPKSLFDPVAVAFLAAVPIGLAILLISLGIEERPLRTTNAAVAVPAPE